MEPLSLAPTDTELLLRLAGPCARLGLNPRTICLERAHLLLAHSEQEELEARLADNLGEIVANRPPEPSDPGDTRGMEAQAEWESELELTQARLAEAQCTFRLPLDHEYGERLPSGSAAALAAWQAGDEPLEDDRDLVYWLSADDLVIGGHA